jgi:hypothetical protein
MVGQRSPVSQLNPQHGVSSSNLVTPVGILQPSRILGEDEVDLRSPAAQPEKLSRTRPYHLSSNGNRTFIALP